MDRLLLWLVVLGLLSLAGCTPLRQASVPSDAVQFEETKTAISTAEDLAFWQQRSREFAPALDSLAKN